MIKVSKPSITDSSANLLADTDLQSAPEDGAYIIRIQSTQADGIYSVSAGQDIVVKAQLVPYTWAIEIKDDWPADVIYVRGGTQVVMPYTEDTASTVALIVEFYSLDELP